MKVQVPVSTESTKLGKRSLQVKPGLYHFRVDKFEPFASNANGNHLLHLEIVWADEDHQAEIGKVHVERLWSQGRQGTDDTEWSDRLNNLAIASGLMSRAEHDAHLKSGTAPEHEFDVDLSGRHLVGELEERLDSNGNKYVNIAGRGFALYHVNSPESKDFPVLDGLLKKCGVERKIEQKADRDFSGLM